MVAVGITSKGERLEFNCSDGILCCWDRDLVSLEVPDGVELINCWNNQLTELIIPESVTYLHCENNQLTKLKVPEGVITVWCYNNKLSELLIPESVTSLKCDKEIKGLEKFIGEIRIVLWYQLDIQAKVK